MSVRNDENLLDYLLNIVEFDHSFRIRHFVVSSLCKHPPFKLNSDETTLNSDSLVNKLWRLLGFDIILFD
jgi:hypothetical protein